jgi:hypothetical protein
VLKYPKLFEDPQIKEEIQNLKEEQRYSSTSLLYMKAKLKQGQSQKQPLKIPFSQIILKRKNHREDQEEFKVLLISKWLVQEKSL